MLYLCVNAQKYRTTIKFHDITFTKMKRIWNQFFQKMIIVEVRLGRVVWVGKSNYCRNAEILVKTSGKIFKSAVRL